MLLKLIFAIIITMLLPACTQAQPQTKEQWQPLHSDLWQSNTGEIGYPILVFYEGQEDFSRNFLTYVSTENNNVPMKDFIDIDSFQKLENSTYYKDNKHLYRFYPMAHGGIFSVFDDGVDYDSFQVLNDCFAKDKNKIFQIQADEDFLHYDYASFQTCKDCGCVAKDKNTYFVIGEKLKQTEVDKLIADPKTYQETRNALIFLRKQNIQ